MVKIVVDMTVEMKSRYRNRSGKNAVNDFPDLEILLLVMKEI